jgi:hypothetical protein
VGRAARERRVRMRRCEARGARCGALGAAEWRGELMSGLGESSPECGAILICASASAREGTKVQVGEDVTFVLFGGKGESGAGWELLATGC